VTENLYFWQKCLKNVFGSNFGKTTKSRSFSQKTEQTGKHPKVQILAGF
jgi:hypothetical protein